MVPAEFCDIFIHITVFLHMIIKSKQGQKNIWLESFFSLELLRSVQYVA